MSEYKCASCSTTDIQKLSMVYESGTSTISGTTTGTSTGVGIGRGGLGIGTAVNSSRTSGTQTTELAKRAAPPEKKFGAGWIGIGVAVGIVAMAIGGIVIALVVIGGSVAVAQPGIRYNRDVFPSLRARWEQSWLCHRCGAIFQPGGNALPASQQPAGLIS
jgi:hypothetical protein